MQKHRKWIIALLLICILSMSVSAFNLPKDGTGKMIFFAVKDDNVKAYSSKPINDMDQAQAHIATTSKKVASGVIAICILTSIFIMALNIVKLAQNADNPNERRKAIKGILISGIVFIGFGGYAIVTNILMNFVT